MSLCVGLVETQTGVTVGRIFTDCISGVDVDLGGAVAPSVLQDETIAAMAKNINKFLGMVTRVYKD